MRPPEDFARQLTLTPTRPICGQRCSVTRQGLATARRLNRRPCVSCLGKDISTSCRVSAPFRERRNRRNEVLVATRLRYPKPIACAKHCSVLGGALMPRLRTAGTLAKTCAMRCGHVIQPMRRPRDTTQHGANRLGSVGLSALTVVPQRQVGGIRLAVSGGEREPNGGFTFGWPIWREPMSLAGIRALLGHPHLDRTEIRAALGIVERRRVRRISFGKFMNVTRAEVTPETD